MLRFPTFSIATVLLTCVLAALLGPAAARADTGFSSSRTWTWVHQAMPTAGSADQFAEATVSGATTERRNAGFVLRRSSSSDYAQASFSGTRYQVRVYTGGRESLLVDEPFPVTTTGTARVELVGSTVSAFWNGSPVSSDTLPALAALAGTGTGLTVWQDRPDAVTFQGATTGAFRTAFTSPTAWSWAHQAMPTATSRDHFLQATVAGNTTTGRNAAFVLRRSGNSYAMASFSGTRYQVRTYSGGRESLIVDKPFRVTSAGTARVELAGSTLRATWDGAPVSSDTVPALEQLSGNGTGLAIWQDKASAVAMTGATAGTAAATPTSVTTSTEEAEAVWSSGVSGDGAADDRFGSWRGRSVEIAGTWNDNKASQEWQWSVQPGFEFGSWQRDLDVAVGGIYKDSGETWEAAAGGAYDTRWRNSLTNLTKAWGDRPGTLYIRFAHEFNGDWYPWSVKASEAEAFKAAWKRFRAIQQEVAPRHELVFCVNAETSSSLALDWRKAYPGAEHVDVMAVDYYNQYPFVRTAAEFRTQVERVDGTGAPLGLERHRQFAAAEGLPFAIAEWSSNAEDGDSPAFMTELHGWLRTHGGAGPGKVLYEIQFNVASYGEGKFQLFPTTQQSAAATEYARLW